MGERFIFARTWLAAGILAVALVVFQGGEGNQAFILGLLDGEWLRLKQHYGLLSPLALFEKSSIGEFQTFVALLSGIFAFWISQRGRLRHTVSFAIGSLVIYTAGDLFLTAFLEFRTYPIEGAVLLVAFGMLSIATRSNRDRQERLAIERALSGYVSDERLHRLMTGKERLHLEGRQKILTALLVDIDQFSKLVDGLTTEEIFVLMQRFSQRLDPIVMRFGGMIDKKMGDGLLAIFGDSDAIEKPEFAAEAAVQCAVQIQEMMDRQPLLVGPGQRVKVRIGVSTGLMLVGNAGSLHHFNYTAVGEAVTLTQQLEQACPAGGILVSEATYKSLPRGWLSEPMDIHAKYGLGWIRAYRVRGHADSWSAKRGSTSS